MRRFTGACAAAALLASSLLPLNAVAATPTPPPGAKPPAARPLGASLSAPVRVVVMMKSQPTAPDAANEAARLAEQNALISDWSTRFGLKADRQFAYLVNGFSAEVPADKLTALALEPGVASVRRERQYEPSEVAPSEYNGRGLEGVPAAHRATGADGTGMVISIIDSGIDPTHQDLKLDDCAAAKIKTINAAPEGHFTCKVPDGYNYADENFEIADTTSSMHGMHVAGIAAANGGANAGAPADFASTGRITGVAPNAQLLAMKVFSNKGGKANDADIIAAIEDSVKKGADVINMSLGSPNSVKDASDGAARAIDLARKAGVITVVAAGNDGLNFSPRGETDDVLGLFDDGTAGSPAVQSSAFTVASINNTIVTQSLATWTAAGSSHDVGYEVSIGTADGKDHALVDVGLGQKTDYAAGVDLAGKYALVERGGITFTEKFQNAVDHGAAGVVVFNSAAGGDEFVAMGGVDAFTVFGASLRRTDGLAIRSALAGGQAVTVRFTDGTVSLPSPDGLGASSFTSWGTTAGLDFEPEIAGIGGSVYSTLNNNQYGTKSGTSMASPNVAGMSALMLQEFAKRFPATPRGEQLDLLETALMNTARIPLHDGVPAAPRQVGAGLAQVDRAITSNVFATVDSRPSVALRQVDGARTFTVTLTNRGATAETFTVPAQQVLNETNAAGEATTTFVSAETLTASAATISVPAGGTAQVTFTLTPDKSSSHFIEGWAVLDSVSDTQPDLAVPYLGFVGDWNAEPIVAPVGEDIVPGVAAQTQLATSWAGMTIPMSSWMGDFWLSPNGDKDIDVAAPLLALRRNAAEIRYSVLDANGQVVKVLGTDQMPVRQTLGLLAIAPDPTELLVTGRSFDGLRWDPTKGDLSAFPDGRYTYRVESRLSADFGWQVVDMPFGLDATAPVITFGALQGTTLTMTVTETGSGVLSDPEVTAADGSALAVTKVADGQYTVEVPAGTPYLTASVLDAGFNHGVATKVFAPATLVVPDAEGLNAPGAVVGATSWLVVDGQLQVQGYVSGDVAKVTVGGVETSVTGGRFTALVPLAEGANTIPVIALDAGGAEVARVVLTPTFDSQPPTLVVSPASLDANGQLPVAADGSVTVSGTVTDTRPGATLTVKVGTTTVPVAADGTFTATVTPPADATSIAVVASDGANTTTQTLLLAGRNEVPGWQPPLVTNADCRQGLASCFVPGASPDATRDGQQFTIRGEVQSPTSRIRFTPEVRANAGGTWKAMLPINATINADGSFSAVLPMGPAISHFRVEVWDADGTQQVDMAMRLFFDVVAPTINFDSPVLTGGTLYSNTDVVRFKGSVADDGWGYTFGINDSQVVDVFYYSGIGPGSNARTFDTPVAVKNGDQLLLLVHDANGNALSGIVPVVVDKVAPIVGLPVAEGTRVTDGRVLTSTADDPNLASMKVTLNGEVISDVSTPLTSEITPVESVLIDSRDLADGATPTPMPSPDPAGAAGAAGAATTPAASAAATPGATATPAATASPTAAAGQAAPAVASPFAVQTGTTVTHLEHQLDASTLADGSYTLTVESRDLAGNVTAKSVTFAVDAPPVVTGPDAVELSVYREALGDQASLAKQVLASFTTSPDTTLSLAPGTVLTDGANTVTVVATDAGGQRAEKVVTVTVTLKQVTLTSGAVTATGPFRSDDVLGTNVGKTADGTITYVLVHNDSAATIDAVITLPGVEGSTVVRVLPDGRLVGVESTWANGVLMFTGPVDGTYRVVPPAAPGGDGGDPVPVPQPQPDVTKPKLAKTGASRP